MNCILGRQATTTIPVRMTNADMLQCPARIERKIFVLTLFRTVSEKKETKYISPCNMYISNEYKKVWVKNGDMTISNFPTPVTHIDLPALTFLI